MKKISPRASQDVRYSLLKCNSGRTKAPLSLRPGSCPCAFHLVVHLCSMSKALLNCSNPSLAQPESVQTQKIKAAFCLGAVEETWT